MYVVVQRIFFLMEQKSNFSYAPTTISKSSDRARSAFSSHEHALSFSSVRYSFRDLSINVKCCHWRLIVSWRMAINFLEKAIEIGAGIFKCHVLCFRNVQMSLSVLLF